MTLLNRVDIELPVIFSAEFDNHPGKVGKVELRDDDLCTLLSVNDGDKDLLLMEFRRDQWGTFITADGMCIAQEDGTRSFLDGLIKCLQEVRKQTEVTEPATITIGESN